MLFVGKWMELENIMLSKEHHVKQSKPGSKGDMSHFPSYMETRPIR
jgi:hypothetical protein